MSLFSKCWQRNLEEELQKGKHDITQMLFLLSLCIKMNALLIIKIRCSKWNYNSNEVPKVINIDICIDTSNYLINHNEDTHMYSLHF